MYLVINKWVIAVNVSYFSGQCLRNHWTLDIGVLGYIGIVWPKEHSPEVWSVPPVTPCIFFGDFVKKILNCTLCLCYIENRFSIRGEDQRINQNFLSIRLQFLPTFPRRLNVKCMLISAWSLISIFFFGHIQLCLHKSHSRGADKSLAPPDWKKQFKFRHFSSDAEVIAAADTWLDGQTSDFFFFWVACRS